MLESMAAEESIAIREIGESGEVKMAIMGTFELRGPKKRRVRR